MDWSEKRQVMYTCYSFVIKSVDNSAYMHTKKKLRKQTIPTNSDSTIKKGVEGCLGDVWTTRTFVADGRTNCRGVSVSLTFATENDANYMRIVCRW